jgi:glycosyltransferase involved in cell wall biosynthesis
MSNLSPEHANGSAAVRPFRVLLVDLATGFGGPETRVLSLATALQGRVARCAVAVLEGKPLHERLRSLGLPCEPISRRRSDPRLGIELALAIHRGRYQVMDAHNIQSIFWGHLAAVLAGARGRVTTVHSDYRQEYRGLRRAFYPAVFSAVRPIARHFVHVTDQLQQSAEARGDGVRSTLIHNSVPVADSPDAATDVALRSEWRWPASAFIVASVGRLFPVKGHAYLIDAMAELADLAHVRLLIVGDGPLRGDLEQQVAQARLSERIRFLGFRHDISRILGAIDCVCLPSLWELLPYAALEAAACARPIVATNVGGVTQLLQHETSGLLVPPRDPHALADAIRMLVEHPDRARRLGRAAYDLVRRSFSTEAMVAKTLDAYESALRRA